MLKLYKNVDDKLLYWETWSRDDNKSEVVHWGTVGARGQNKVVESSFLSSSKSKVQKEIDKLVNDGYHEIDIEEHYTLLIEYDVDGMGNTEDIEKRTRLQNRMDQTLGWTGLGMCDGGSIGSGTMEVCCYVVDFEVAKKIIEKDLLNTEFSDYKRIYDENEE